MLAEQLRGAYSFSNKLVFPHSIHPSFDLELGTCSLYLQVPELMGGRLEVLTLLAGISMMSVLGFPFEFARAMFHSSPENMDRTILTSFCVFNAAHLFINNCLIPLE